jgi:SpoVK/Ycf46/Vps4 family AAA+-type ATPase
MEDHILEKFFKLRMLAKDEISGLMTGAELVGACREAAVNVMRKTLMSTSCHEAGKMSIDDPNQLIKALKETLETILRETKPLLSDAHMLDEYTRFEEEHQS